MRRLAPALLMLTATPALAHTGHADTAGFVHGLMHPMLGADHVLAMLAVGLWSGFVLPRRAWGGAASFMAAMTVGAGLAWAGVAFGAVEPVILLSVLAFGLLVMATRRGQSQGMTLISLAVIGSFGLAHGFAHAQEATGGMLPYLSGFLLATGALHLAGIGLAKLISSRTTGLTTQRHIGFAIAAAGIAMLAG